jgi:signal transduction histidine kinase
LNSACLSSIFDLSPSGIIAFNTKGIATAINHAALQMLSLSKERHIGISSQSLEQEINKNCLHKMRHDGNIDTSLLITMNEHPLIIKRVIRPNPSSSIASEIHYFYDITHETNVSEMKTELLFTAAHELRTSLASIQGYTELLLKRPHDEQSKEFLGIILKQSNRLNNMIHDILDLGRSDRENILELTTEKFEVNNFVAEIAKSFFVHRKPIISLLPQPVFIDADNEKLTQAIINIYSNAKKYSATDSPIHINITLDSDSNMVGIQVIDEGIGMTPVQQSQLFTRFYRANPEGNIVGTGLGLCFVKEILELHCGGVEVHSQKDEGTQVTLWIPTVDNSKLH